MKLPELDKPQRYTGLYVVDFGDHTGVGFTAQEVAELLESEKYQHIKVLKIHKAFPDGKLELKGIPNETFQLEAGLFFYSQSETEARDHYQRLVALAVTQRPPCKAKVHLATYDDGTLVTALIYPAEYDDEVSSWLLVGDYYTAGAAEGGAEAAERYYKQAPKILERHQLYGEQPIESRSGTELLAGLKVAVQR
ncbi:hypothetical protein ACFL6U_24115 [Planctomycetota bacterium]